MQENNKSPQNRLTTRDREIIEHVVRYRISTNEVIQKLFFEGAHATSVTRITARLCSTGWLSAFPLIYPTKYFVPGKLAASAYGLPLARTYPLGPQSLPTEFAVLEYAAANTPHVVRLDLGQIQSLLPWYEEEWFHAPHCKRGSEEKQTLELVRVDLGGPADHIARKCRRDIGLRHKAVKFTHLIANQAFGMAIITGSTQKAAAIQSALKSHHWPENLTFRIAVFVSLIPILPRSL
jgi:hypothetical protein